MKNSTHILFLLGILGGFSGLVLAQAQNPSLTAHFTEEAITLDGQLEESTWQTAEVAGDFVQFFPSDTARARYPTEVRVAYNETHLFVGVIAHAQHRDYVVSTLRRDFSGTANDNVTLLFDTFRDGANAFAFGVTPYGVQREILVSNGGAVREGFNVTWDVKWRAESFISDSAYTVEVAIPFTSLKFPEGSQHWRFRPYRWNMQTNEQTTWAQVPQTQLLANLAFMGDLYFDRPLGRSRTPGAIIPYVNTLASRDYNLPDGNQTLAVGADAKLSVGDGMALDLTVNPDFSNAEVDAIFTNLTRFELNLPEQRQFFIDNNDLFASFGDYYGQSRPFFSRRIGLARDTNNNLIQNRILAGARLSGKLNENWRLGALSVQTAADEDNSIAGNNNTMLTMQRKVASRSTVGAFVINRQSTAPEFWSAAFAKTEDTTALNADFNRVVGVEYNLASGDGKWNGKTFLHKSFNPGDNKGNYTGQVSGVYTTQRWVLASDFLFVGDEFQSDLGFVPRRDFIRIANRVERYFFAPNSDKINRHGIQVVGLQVLRPTLDYKYTDHSYRARYSLDFTNQATATAQVENSYIFLTEDFDPARGADADATALPGSLGYTFTQFTGSYTSSPTQLLTYGFEVAAGEFFNGTRYGIGSTLGYRFQPWVSLGVALNYDRIRLPEPYATANLWLASPRVDVAFSRKLFWTTLAQYSNQRESLGINSRLQWRFAQLSDLFLVYNDNYQTDSWQPRFRSINLKVSYWLNSNK